VISVKRLIEFFPAFWYFRLFDANTLLGVP